MPYCCSVGQSAGPTKSIALNPILFTALHNSSTERKLYVQRQTEWLILPLNFKGLFLFDVLISPANILDAGKTTAPAIKFFITVLLLFILLIFVRISNSCICNRKWPGIS